MKQDSGITDIFDFESGTDNTAPGGTKSARPLIGISVNIEGNVHGVNRLYEQSVVNAGGIPLLIPAISDIDVLTNIAERIDGLLLTGGADVDGAYFREETLDGLVSVDLARDRYDFMLLKLASDRQIPILGICRGMQVVNIAFGGNIYQDLAIQFPVEPLEHSVLTEREKPVHEVHVSEGSVLRSLFTGSVIGVNSRHHQAVKDIAPGFKATAFSPEGVVEAIEGYPARPILGVQWHPENMAVDGEDENMKSLFSFFVEESGLFRRAKQLHSRMISVDSHCDTPSLLSKYPINIGRRDPVAKVDLVKMTEGHIDAVFMAAYVPQGERNEESSLAAYDKAAGMIKDVKEQLMENSGYASLAETVGDMKVNKAAGKKSVLLGVENGYALGGDVRNVAVFKETGVNYITLCHNGDNDICDSAAGNGEHGGLSAFGKKVVREMNRHKIMVDVSHAAESTFFDVLDYSSVPIVATHSSARALCDHHRNLTDKQIKELAVNGGVMQICLYKSFLVEEGEASVSDAVDHIDYVVDLVGVDYVGIGSDFDGGGGIVGCQSSNELINITMELLRRGYSDADIAKIWGGNLCRVMEAVARETN